jgi:hypothetical protein
LLELHGEIGGGHDAANAFIGTPDQNEFMFRDERDRKKEGFIGSNLIVGFNGLPNDFAAFPERQPLPNGFPTEHPLDFTLRSHHRKLREIVL